MEDLINKTNEIPLESVIEGIMYLFWKPITLVKLSFVTQCEVNQVMEALSKLQNKYDQMNDPLIIEHKRNEDFEKYTVELKLREKALKTLRFYEFMTSQELSIRYYRYMSIIMHLEYVKNKKITKEILEKEFKKDKRDLEKILRVLLKFGYIEKKQNTYITSDRFLKRMGLPTEKESVKKVLKDKTIKFALDYFGFENE